MVLGGADVAGFVLMGLAANSLVGAVPTATLWLALPALLLIPRLVKVACVPLLKWAVLGRVSGGEHSAYGWVYTRWLLMETVMMDTEAAFLTHLQGTWFMSVLWRSLGARVGRGTCLLGSALGSEYDLKSVGDRVILEHACRADADWDGEEGRPPTDAAVHANLSGEGLRSFEIVSEVEEVH